MNCDLCKKQHLEEDDTWDYISCTKCLKQHTYYHCVKCNSKLKLIYLKDYVRNKPYSVVPVILLLVALLATIIINVKIAAAFVFGIIGIISVPAIVLCAIQTTIFVLHITDLEDNKYTIKYLWHEDKDELAICFLLGLVLWVIPLLIIACTSLIGDCLIKLLCSLCVG